MKKLLWLIPAASLLAGSAYAAEVFSPHDKFPGAQRSLGNACDGDAHDPAKCKAVTTAGVPEPGTLGLMLFGLGGAAVTARRKKK